MWVLFSIPIPKRKPPRSQSSWLQNRDVLCFLWGTNRIYIWYVEESRPPLWSSGHSSWLHIQRSGFDSWRYQIFWEVAGLERGPLSLLSTIEELLERKSSGSGLESREYGRRDPSHWQNGTLYPQKLALTSLADSDHRVFLVFSFYHPLVWAKRSLPCSPIISINIPTHVFNSYRPNWFD
jgi:hypothetical protein